MLLTDDFAFVHMPKTGGTFAVSLFKAAYATRWGTVVPSSARHRLARHVRTHPEGRLPAWALRKLAGFEELEKHGRRRHVPQRARRRPVIGCVRNPFDRYLSVYHFGWWKDERQVPTWMGEMGRSLFPRFPELSFPEYLDFATAVARQEAGRLGLAFDAGLQSVQLIEYYARDLERYRRASLGAAIDLLRDDLADVRVLRTERLNEDVASVLRTYGFEEPAAGALRAGRILPKETESPRPDASRTSVLDDPSLDRVRELEALALAVLGDEPGGRRHDLGGGRG